MARGQRGTHIVTTVLVLGAAGMLGSVVAEHLTHDPSLHVWSAMRDPASAEDLGIRGERLLRFDAEADLLPSLAGVDYVINCIGIIKPYIQDSDRTTVARAVEVNARFPFRLAEAAESANVRVIQIATDCAYSGRDGCYRETAPHDARDVYGKTKSLGEVHSPNVAHVRCSIIGPERRGFVSLLSWFLRQSPGSTVNGYRNHLWNGVTTFHFAKFCRGVIQRRVPLRHLQHLVPADDITKADLLRCFGRQFGRADISILEVDAPESIDRRLRTDDETQNRRLWAAAGYDAPPAIETMVEELAASVSVRA